MQMLRRKMRGSRRALVPLSVVAAVAVGLSGCALKASGGGRIPSSDRVSGHFATFGLNYEVTSGDEYGGSGRLNGSFSDRYADGGPVSMRFDGLEFGFNFAGQNDPCAEGWGKYVSTNKSRPGTGVLTIRACDIGGSGPSNGDTLSVAVDSGPFEGYRHGGTVSNGSIRTSR